VGNTVVAEGPMKAQPGKFTLSGDGLCIGYDSGDAVSQLYKTPGTFKDGTIFGVGVTVEKTHTSISSKRPSRRLSAAAER
jgi:hypothetical protein